MKSYFAKLAARATLTNAPTAPSLSKSKAHDSFADSPTDYTAPPPTGVVQTSRVQSRSIDKTQTSVEISEHKSPARPRKIDSEVVSEADRRTQSLLNPTTPPRTVEHVTETKLQPTLHPQENRSQRNSEDKADVHESPQLQARVNEIEKTTPSKASKDREESKAERDSETDQRLSELKHDQDVLLRKADAFMVGIFQHRALSPPPEPDSENEKGTRDSPSKLVVPSEHATRLQPTPRPTATTEPAADEQPSLVIGSLTVEVLPAPVQPVAAPQRVVVVRGGRTVGRGIQSSQRFGLGQF